MYYNKNYNAQAVTKESAGMTEKELRRLSRAELLELLIEQGERAEALQQKLSAAEHAIQKRKLDLTEVGSIAEAALKLNGVFEAAENAAKQYLEGVRQVGLEQLNQCEQREAASRREAEKIIAEANEEAARIVEAAKTQAQSRANDVNDKIYSLRKAFDALLNISQGAAADKTEKELRCYI